MVISDIISLFIKNWASKEELYLKLGVASEIDEIDFTFKFTPIDEKSTVENVRMKTIVDGGPESFVIVPKEGTNVVVGFHSNTVGQCLIVKEADKVLINTNIAEENAKSKTIYVKNDFNINCDDVKVSTASWIFNDGTFDGLIKINELTTKLNDLISEVNSFKDKFNNHKHLGVRTGSGVSGIKNVPNVANLTNFDKNDFENPIIKH